MPRLKAILLAVLVCFSATHCGAAGLAEFLLGRSAANGCVSDGCGHDGAFSTGAQCQPSVLVKSWAAPALAPQPAAPLSEIALAPLAAACRPAGGRADERRDWLAATTVFRERRAAPARAPDSV